MISFALLSSLFFAFTASPVQAQDEFHDIFGCFASSLTMVNPNGQKYFTLDLKKAASDIAFNSVMREYDIPNTDVRVTFTLRYLPAQSAAPARVEITKLLMQKSGTGWKLMMSFYSPVTIDLPIPEKVPYVIKTGEPGDKIPPFDLECKLRRTKIIVDPAACVS
jgi:hypothetical protein